MNYSKSAALRAAFPLTIPVMTSYVFLGITYGILAVTSGLSPLIPIINSIIIYTGSTEFLSVSILLSAFNPLAAFLTAFMVGARHLFYGISMLDKYRDTGRKKFYLIFTTSDETFSINYSAKIPAGVAQNDFYLWVSLLDQSYWVIGSTIGALFGSLITFEIQGLDFVMTTMFVTIFLSQWCKEHRDAKAMGFFRCHASSVIGIAASVIALALFGPDQFIIPAMAMILMALLVLRPVLDTEEEQTCQ